MPSPFPKKKLGFKISISGSLCTTYFYSKKPPTEIMDAILEQMSSLQDPIIIPEPATFKLSASYFRIKPLGGI